MKTMMNVRRALYALGATFFLASCQKNTDVAATTNTSTTSTSTTIAVAATQAATSTQRVMDSVYVVQPCRRGEHRDSVAQSTLPVSVTAYINTNYSGAAFHKAFELKDASSAVKAYVVVIYYNGNPVGLQFDRHGAYVNVLEQREKGDLNGAGFHNGGRFQHRDGRGRDSIALDALPSAVSSYFAGNYATDTLVKAVRNCDSSIVVLSKNNGLFATTFTQNGTFVSRTELPSKQGAIQSIELAALPSTAASYLSQTYPNYVFEKAFSVSQNGTLQGFVVVIDANNTKYAVAFDAAGNFVKAKTLR